MTTGITAEKLRYEEERLRTVAMPARAMTVTRGLGSGLARPPGAWTGRFWAVGDRGPNLKLRLARDRYGLDLAGAKEAKLMPCLDIGPALAELQLDGGGVRLVRTLALPLSGVPIPGSDNGEMEPALALDGSLIPPDPLGADTEGVAIAADGSFWIGDEYGPSLLHVAAGGQVLERWLPEGTPRPASPFPSRAILPALAAARRINRGFEALALSTDGTTLHLAFQSPLAHPDEATHAAASHVRLWSLATDSGEHLAEYLYPLDPPDSFGRDRAAGQFERSDIKVSELATLPDDSLLVLERGSLTTKLYRVALHPAFALPVEQRDPLLRPTLEQRSAAGTLGALPVLDKRLILSTDDLPQIPGDLEGMLVIDARTLLLVNDNDFGIEDVATEFWRVTLPEPLFVPDAPRSAA